MKMAENNRRKKRIVVCILLFSFLLFGGLRFHAAFCQNERLSENEQENEWKADLVWQGRSYRYNSHLSNYLLMGIDRETQEQTNVGRADAGQADAIYLLSYNRKEKSAAVISIPRDTQTLIRAYGPGGNLLGETTDHISLSYAYGDGAHESCRLAIWAVSGLFHEIPVLWYCAMDLGGIPVLTASVGEVTVTIPNDSLASADPELTAGRQITLQSEKTEQFVRYRDTDAPQSALERMERQQAFLQAFGERAREKAKEQPSFAGSLYRTLEPYMVTNLSAQSWAQLFADLGSSRVRQGWTVPGQTATEGGYDVYQVDEEALMEKVAATFYQEITETEAGNN